MNKLNILNRKGNRSEQEKKKKNVLVKKKEREVFFPIQLMVL